MKKFFLWALLGTFSAQADTVIQHIRNHTDKPLHVGSYTVGCFIPQQTIPAQRNNQPGINTSRISLSGPVQATGKLFVRTLDGSRQLIVDDTQNDTGCCGAWRVVLSDGKMSKSACLQPKLFQYGHVDIDIYEHDFTIAQSK